MQNWFSNFIECLIYSETMSQCTTELNEDGKTENISTTNWNLCALCQEDKAEALQCPAESKRYNVGAGYATLAENIHKFDELGWMPMHVCTSRLNEGDGIESTLSRYKACWHKSCYLNFNSTKLKRAEKRLTSENDQPAGGKYTRSNSQCNTSVDSIATCFICDQFGTHKKPLHSVCTLTLDARVRQCAFALQDQSLLAKLSGAGDLIASEASYHSSCLSSIYKKAGAICEKDSVEDNVTDQIREGIALAELVSYIEESRLTSDTVHVFKLADLASMYTSRMEQLGASITARVHTTRLKDRLLSKVPGLEAHKQGRDILLAFREDLGVALQRAYQEDCDDKAIHLTKAASIVRREMMAAKNTFKGSFESNCQSNSVPTSLLSLVNMILYGPSIQTQASPSAKAQSGLSIAQLLMFNSYLRRRDGELKRQRHSKTRETPLPVYIGLSIHAKTRSRDLVENMHSLGLCVSYDRVLAISTELGNSVCRRYHEENVVCPPNLRMGLFTTAAVDNIDHNPSSTTAQDSFHGTGISMFQHATAELPGDERPSIVLEQTVTGGTKSVVELPNTYAEVTPAVLPNKYVPVPETLGQMRGDGNIVEQAIKKEFTWLETTKEIANQENLQDDQQMSWSAHHASEGQHDEITQSVISSLLPLFPDQAKSVAMIRHSMDIIKACVNHLNPGQVPVIAMDQPLYTVAKQIQWSWPDKYGETFFIIMFGGLHIEMAFLKAIGGWLDGSGWTAALAEANVASIGTADSFIKATSVTRTRRAHQVTASALYIMISKAYVKYKESLEEGGNMLTFDNWCIERVAAVPQFQFWFMALQLELLLLVFIRSIRQANFDLYIDTLSNMVPWFFALNHTNYARWIPVHLRDMCALQHKAPNISSQFETGMFTVYKTQRRFSAIAIDQAHEQNNAMVKGDGGAVGLTENASALRRWMVSGPEMARLVNEFEADIATESRRNQDNSKHHEQSKSTQVTFL